MALYTPPPGNSTNFNFIAGGYSPPLGNSLAFPFGASATGSATGSAQGTALLSGIGSEIARSRGTLTSQATLSAVSLSGAHGLVSGRALLRGVGVAPISATGSIQARSTLNGQSLALKSTTGTISGQVTLTWVSQAGHHGTIAGQATLAATGLARIFAVSTGAIPSHAAVTGVGMGANALATLLATRQFVMADLFTLTLARTGQTLTFTNVDRPVWWNNTYYDPYSLAIEGLQFKKSVGLTVNEQAISLSATRNLLINGRPWFDEIANGLLDHAEIRRERVFAPDWNSTPVGSVILFDGIVSTIDSLTTSQCQLKVKSYLSLLNQPMPRNSWQTSCLHTLFDAGCTLAKTAYQVIGQVGAGSTLNTLNWNGATSGYYWQGTITFTSGPNTGLSRTIKLATGSQLMLHLPLPWMPLTGDSFFAYPGCDKTFATCKNRFNNTANNRSYPFIPTPTIAL